MPDPIRKRFGYGQLWPLRPAVQPEPSRMTYPGSTFPASDSLPFFQKKAWTIMCKTDPDPIWMAWSGFGQTHLVQKQAGLQESSADPVSGKPQPSRYQFLIQFQTRLRSSADGSDIIVQNRPGSDLVLADCVSQVLAKRIRSRFWPMLPSLSGSLDLPTDTNFMRHALQGVFCVDVG